MVRISIVTFFVFLIIAATASWTAAQQLGPPKYNVGDRVQFDLLETGNIAKAKWVNATITKVQTIALSSTLSQVTYEVTVDPLPGKLPNVVMVSQRNAEYGMSYSGDPSRTTGYLRPLDGGGVKFQRDKLHVDENDTVLADRELLDCDHVKASARNGTSPPTGLAKTLIRCLFETPSRPGQDGATKVDITEITSGTPHRWNRNEDLGSGANLSTIVYPFRVKFDQETFYRQHNELYTGVERIFTCYVAVGEWFCGQAQRLKEGEKRLIPVVP